MLPHLVLLSVALAAQLSAQTFEPELHERSSAPRLAQRAIELAPGLEISLFASEPDVANAVALDVTPDGRVWIAETYRLRRGVFDMRDHLEQVDLDLAARTVADRVAFMPDLEPDLESMRAAHERIRLLVDDDGDRRADRSLVFADGFHDLAHGIASGVLVHDGDVWFACIPELWRLRDRDGDGHADEREAVHTGYGVRFQFLGHDLHGLRIGPDRRLYFSIGDRGLHVETEDGIVSCPDTGAVLRCELDGSKLELFATGLRNPQELAFDDFGNWFTGDNNSDSGDRARWVYLIEGGDCGWRCGYQWLGDRGPWNRERMWHPPHRDQPAWIVPPVANVAHGPSGLTAYPGTGLPARYENTFFLCDFRATPRVSGIVALRSVPKGAGFELELEERFAWGLAATDVEFGPDGVYVSDWVEGWVCPMRGRVWRIEPRDSSDKALAARTASLLRDGMSERGEQELADLLVWPDRRVRLAAQFALVDRGAVDALAKVAREGQDRRARLHAIWGLGCIARVGDAATCAELLPVLEDGDAEIAGHAARACADAGYRESAAAIAALAKRPSSRARFFAAEALGKVGAPEHAVTLLTILRKNDDRDPWLRHTATLALARLGDFEALREAAGDASPAVRRGALLALAHLRHPDCALFLRDPDASVVLEAARAIDRVPIEEALPALAALTVGPAPFDDALARRALNANRWLGTAEAVSRIARFAERHDAEVAVRREALDILTEWREPSGRDRISGDWRPVPPRADVAAGDAALGEIVPRLVARERGALLDAAIGLARTLEIARAAEALAAIAAGERHAASTRVAALAALAALDFDGLPEALAEIDAEHPVALQIEAARQLAELDPASAVRRLAALTEHGRIRDRQRALLALGACAAPEAEAALAKWVDALEAGAAPSSLQLEIVEAVEARGRAEEAGELAAHLERWRQSLPGDDLLAPYRIALDGGDPRAGKRVFSNHAAAQCIRCHAVDGGGGSAGPPLDGIGSRVDRAHLLESLIVPTAKIAEGYALELVELADGTTHAGVLGAETEDDFELVDAAGQRLLIEKADVSARSSTESSTMPPMGGMLTLRELRDVIAYLASLEEKR